MDIWSCRRMSMCSRWPLVRFLEWTSSFGNNLWIRHFTFPSRTSKLGCALIFASKRCSETEANMFLPFSLVLLWCEMWKSDVKQKWNEAKTKQKRSKNCHRFRFEAKWSETEEKKFSLRCEKSAYLLVFASEAKWKWNEAKTKRKRSKNCKAKKGKVKFWDNL